MVSQNAPLKNTEQELKWIISHRQDWLKLQEALGKAERELRQKNVYLDTEDAYFAARRSMLRLREENGRWLFVYKRGLSLENGYFSALEIEEEVSAEVALAISRGQLQAVDEGKVYQQIRQEGFEGTLHTAGEVVNIRRVWPIKAAGLEGAEKFELDCTSFDSGHTEYELELETLRGDILQEEVQTWAEGLGIKLIKQKATKYERFLRYSAVRKPTISCLMPIYNCAETLASAVSSICRQTFKSWELILVDDGSSDDTVKIAEKLAATDPRIRVFGKEHGGIVDTLNFAFKQSRAPFIARMDGDDISHPERFAEQMRYLQAHPDIAAVGCKIRVFPKKSITEGMMRYERWLNKACLPEILERDIFVESPLVHPSVLLRRSALEEVGLYEDGRWPEDYQLWLRMWLKGIKMAKVEKTLFFWRDLPKRLTRVDQRCSHDALRELKVTFFLKAFFTPAQEEQGLRSLPFDKRQLIIWGAGPNGKALAKTLRSHGLEPAYYTDILPARHGQTICGLKVLSLEQLPAPEGYFLVTAVGNPNSREEIRAFLKERGWQEGRDFRCMAGISD